MPRVTELDRDSLDPLYRQLASRLQQAIDSGRLAPGARLPSEAELIAIHGVSRVTVRQAIGLLQRQGKVAARRGKGTFVLGPVVRHDLDALQGFRDALVGQGIEPQTRLLEFSADGRAGGGIVAAAAHDGGPPADLDLPVRLQRLYAVDGRPFALVTAWLPQAAAAIGRARAERLTVYQIVEGFLGTPVARAEVVIRSQRAAASVARLLGLARSERQVLVMERRSSTAAGVPCEFMRIQIVPDRFEFRLGVQGPLALAAAVHRVDAVPRGKTKEGVRR